MSEREQEIVRFKQMLNREVSAYALIWETMEKCYSPAHECPLFPALKALAGFRYGVLVEKAASLGVETPGMEAILPPGG